MNLLGKPTGNLTEYSLYPLTSHLLIQPDPWIALPPCGVLPPHGGELNLIHHPQGILNLIIVIGLITIQLASRGQLQRQKIKCVDIMPGSRQEDKLNRDAICCCYHVDSDSIEVSLLGGDISSELLSGDYPTSVYPDVVADRDREGIYDVLHVDVGLFQEHPYLQEEIIDKLLSRDIWRRQGCAIW